MADKPQIVGARTRAETPEEQALFAWFSEQQKDPAKPLEEGARQIISLVTAIYSVIFGILAFADNPLPIYLTLPVVRGVGAVTVLSYLVALLAALVVVLPDDYRYARASKEQSLVVFEALLRRKSVGLRIAVLSFGIGTLAFAALFIVVLVNL